MPFAGITTNSVSTSQMSLLGSTAINQRCHIGLQQLEVIAASSCAFLGPSKTSKFIQDEESGDAVLVCSSYRLLEQLELSGFVAQLLRETICAHWKVLRTGTTSLVFLAGAWSRVALECLDKGIAIPYIVDGMSKGLDLCVEACMARAVSVKDVCKASFEKKRLSGADDASTEDASVKRDCPRDSVTALNEVHKLRSMKPKHPSKHRITLKHSRHFNSADDTSVTPPSKEFDITYLAEAVSHGCETSMNLVLEASRMQSNYSHNVLDVDKLATCLLPGLSERHSCVHHGYVVVVPAELALLVRRLEGRTLNISLVSGELSEKHRHLGFNRPKNVTCYDKVSNMTGMSQEQEWMESTLQIFLNLKVDIVLVSGVAMQQLKDQCLGHHILVIEHVRPSVLSDFAKAMGALPVSYATQLSEQCLGSGVRVITLREHRAEGKTESTVVNIVADGSSLVTALLTSSIHAELQSLEDRFWKCAYRVHHALKDGKLLPGAGTAELLCIRQLQQHTNVPQPEGRGDTKTASVTPVAQYEQVVLQLMADCWMDYVSTLMMNSGQVETKAGAWTRIAQCIKDWENKTPQCTGSPDGLWKMENYSDITTREKSEAENVTVDLYDNMTVKFETWRRALDVVVLVLLTDAEIVTGVNNSDSKYKDSIIL